MNAPKTTPPLRYSQLTKLDDAELMLHLQLGHADALAVLFDRYNRLVVNIALRILRDAGEAEDLMQSVFLEIFRCSAQFDPAKGSTKVWLLQFAYHRSFNRRHHLALRGLYDEGESHRDAMATSASDGASSSAMMESSHLVRQALGSLKGAQRRILELAFYEGLTMREISEKTGESFDSVRHNYYRGIEKLRSLLCEHPKPSLGSGERVPHVGP
jgi:RNA polymerase sigma-70 factor, ECF subfamily